MTKRSRVRLCAETLEARNSPAILFTYTDVDGDLVSVRISKGDPNTTSIFELHAVAGSLGEQLDGIELGGNLIYQGASITVTAKPQILNNLPHGDGLANVGFIQTSGIMGGPLDLGAISIAGDLGALIAGDGDVVTPGVKSLSVMSLGRFAGDTVDIAGKLGALKVKTDVLATSIHAGSIGAVTIGGSLVGGFQDGSGQILSDGDMGAVKIGGNVMAGGGLNTGQIKSINGKIASVTIGGSTQGAVISSAGDLGFVKIGVDVLGGMITSTGGKIAGVTVGHTIHSGSIIQSQTDMGPLRIGRDAINVTITSVAGKLQRLNIDGDSSGNTIRSDGDLGLTTVGGDMNSGLIRSDNGKAAGLRLGGSLNYVTFDSSGDMGLVKIGGDMYGGVIQSLNGKLSGVTIGGSLVGVASMPSGKIKSSLDMGMIKIGRDLIGGGIDESGFISSGGKLAGIDIGGGLLGGSATATGGIQASGDIGTVKIGGDVQGGSGIASGFIQSNEGKIKSVTVGGSLVGGSNQYTGQIRSGSDLGAVTIAGDVIGGAGPNSGFIAAFTGFGIDDGGNIISVKIGGSLIGGAGFESGSIRGPENIGSVKIGADLRGGSIFGLTATLDSSGLIQGAHLGSIFIGGSIIAGQDESTVGALTKNASIRAEDDIGSITVVGSILGSRSADQNSVFISARGQRGVSTTAKTDIAIGRITVGGRLDLVNILVGFDTSLVGKNADAQIGSVKVNGDWISSNLIAGVSAFSGNGFGNGDDVKLSGVGVKDNSDALGAVSSIASVVIGGHAIGTFVSGDMQTFGIEAQRLKSIRLGGASVALIAGVSNDTVAAGKALPLGVSFGSGFGDGFDFHAFEL